MVVKVVLCGRDGSDDGVHVCGSAGARALFAVVVICVFWAARVYSAQC